MLAKLYNSCKDKSILHFLDAACDLASRRREILANSLDQGPGQKIGRSTFDSDRGDDLDIVSKRRMAAVKVVGLTMALLFLAVSWYLSMICLTQGVSPVLEEKGQFKSPCSGVRHLRIHVVGAVGSTRFHDGGRVQIVGAHTVDDQLGLLRQLVQFGLVKLDGQDVCGL